MKILIAYDGSDCSDAAIVDLRRAGLPESADVVICSVAEIPAQTGVVSYGAFAACPGTFVPDTEEPDYTTGHLLHDAENAANQAAKRLEADFPRWNIKTDVWADDAGSAIVRKAGAWKPDLLVVGSHGRAGIGRLVLGSVSQRVSHHVDCSVRISRHHLHPQTRPISLLVAVNGSDNAKEAVHAVARRNWPGGTEAHVVGVLDSRLAIAAACTPMGAVPVEVEDESRARLSRDIHEAAGELAKAGLCATPQLLAGKPADVLLKAAEEWSVDCIFVGVRGLNGLQRVLLGSVSTALASHARCSVEIVRPSVY